MNSCAASNKNSYIVRKAITKVFREQENAFPFSQAVTETQLDHSILKFKENRSI